MVTRPDVFPDKNTRQLRDKKARRLAARRQKARTEEQQRHDRLNIGADSLSVSTKGSAGLVAPCFGPPSLPSKDPPASPADKSVPKVSDRAKQRMLDTKQKFRAVSQAPLPHAPVPETSMRITKSRRDHENHEEFVEVRLSAVTRQFGAQPASIEGAPVRIIEKYCREGNSTGPAPVVNSPGPAQYAPTYISPNKTGVGVTADKIEQQLSTRAGRLRESLLVVDLGSLLFLWIFL
jgi:hypothetical protein